LKRGSSLNKMEDDSLMLLNATKDVLINSKELDKLAFWRKNGIYVILGGLITIWLLWKIL
jgi:hypothetical protein